MEIYVFGNQFTGCVTRNMSQMIEYFHETDLKVC